jgi:hypothetical protein
MWVVTARGFGSREGPGGAVWARSPVAGSVGEAVMAGVLAHHLQMAGSRRGKGVQRVNDERGYGFVPSGVAARVGAAPMGVRYPYRRGSGGPLPR